MLLASVAPALVPALVVLVLLVALALVPALVPALVVPALVPALVVLAVVVLAALALVPALMALQEMKPHETKTLHAGVLPIRRSLDLTLARVGRVGLLQTPRHIAVPHPSIFRKARAWGHDSVLWWLSVLPRSLQGSRHLHASQKWGL